MIEPGTPWETEISSKLRSSDLILLLVSAAFLASDYCFGTEMEMAMQRMKDGDARVIPILLSPCLWKESRFSELQILPRDAKPVSSWPSLDEAFADVADEINVATKEPPLKADSDTSQGAAPAATVSLTLVRNQVVAYARLYERIRQQMPVSGLRTHKMEETFQRIKALAIAAVPLLPELASSNSPGERLAAVAILQCISSPDHFEFLVELIQSQTFFMGYHAALAMEFAIGATEPRYYPQLARALDDAVLVSASLGADFGGNAVLARAHANLKNAMTTGTLPA